MKKSIFFFLFVFIFCSTYAQQKAAFTFNHVALAVSDLDKSAEFYMNILNLEEITNRTENPERRWLSLGEDKELHLILDKSEIKTNISVHMALNTADFDYFLENVKNSGVPWFDWAGTPEKVSIRADGIRQIYIQDPDGYWIEVNSVGAK